MGIIIHSSKGLNDYGLYDFFATKSAEKQDIYTFKDGVFQVYKHASHSLYDCVIDLNAGTNQIVKEICSKLLQKRAVPMLIGPCFADIKFFLGNIFMGYALDNVQLGWDVTRFLPECEISLEEYGLFVKQKIQNSNINWKKSLVLCPSFLDCFQLLFFVLHSGIRDLKVAFFSGLGSDEGTIESTQSGLFKYLARLFGADVEIDFLNSSCERDNANQQNKARVKIVECNSPVDSVLSLINIINEKRQKDKIVVQTAVVIEDDVSRRLFLDCCKSFGVEVLDHSYGSMFAKMETFLVTFYKLFTAKKDANWITGLVEALDSTRVVSFYAKQELLKSAIAADGKGLRFFLKTVSLERLTTREICEAVDKIVEFLEEHGCFAEEDLDLDISTFARFCKMQPIEVCFLNGVEDGCLPTARAMIDSFFEFAVLHNGRIRSMDDFAVLMRDVLKVVCYDHRELIHSSPPSITLLSLQNLGLCYSQNIYFLPFTSSAFPSFRETNILAFIFKMTPINSFFNSRFCELYSSTICLAKSTTFLTILSQDKVSVLPRHKFLLMMESGLLKVDLVVEKSNNMEVVNQPNSSPVANMEPNRSIVSEFGISGLSLSPTSLELLNKNPVGFYIKYILSVKYRDSLLVTSKRKRIDSARNKSFGLAFHKMACNIACSISEMALEEVSNMVKSIIKECNLDFMAEYKLQKYSISLYNFLKSLIIEGYEFFSEVRLEFRIDEEVSIQCRPDLIISGKNGVIIFDYKTGHQPSFVDELKGVKLQMFMAALCIKRVEGVMFKNEVEDMIYVGFNSKDFKPMQNSIHDSRLVLGFFEGKKLLGEEKKDIIDAFLHHQEIQLKQLIDSYKRGKSIKTFKYSGRKESHDFTKSEEDTYFDIISRFDTIV